MLDVSSEHFFNYYCPLKKGSNIQNKNQCKPYTTQDILKLIAVKILHRKMCSMKYIMKKPEQEKKVKRY